jgi:predicted metalloendopeptidase
VSYEKQLKCQIDHYNSYQVDEIEDDLGVKVHLRGEQTKQKDSADQIGLKISYEAFKKNFESQNDSSLIGLEEYSAEQLFFISFAQLHCSVERPQKMYSKILYDDQSLSQFKVLESLKNLDAFHKSFGCKIEQKMFREFDKRCRI